MSPEDLPDEEIPEDDDVPDEPDNDDAEGEQPAP